MSWMDWYNALAKPGWTPSPATSGLIWTILYPIIAVSFGFVCVQWLRRKLPWHAVAPFAINLVANLLFMPVFAGLRNLPLATLDIAIVWTTILWCVAVIRRRYAWVALAQGPYFVWVSIASLLQIAITAMYR